MKTSLIRKSMLAVVLAAAFGVANTALADKKCHRCDFSDEPIIVVGKPAKQGTAPLPAASVKSAPVQPAVPAAKQISPLPPVPPVGGPQKLAAKPGGGVQAIQLTCSTASTCNDLIAHCAEHGGQWVPGGHNDKGQPTQGDCFID